MTQQTKTGRKGYNLKITPKGDVETTTTAVGKTKIKFRGTFSQRGKTIERTVVAQGKAAAAIASVIIPGQEVGLRCLFENAPANEDGRKGGEYLAVLDLALPSKKAA